MGPIHLQWKAPAVINRFRTGVSLHSHTLHSRETLDFIYRAAAQAPILDLSRGWWTPPLGPHDAWLVEEVANRRSVGGSLPALRGLLPARRRRPTRHWPEVSERCRLAEPE